MALPAAAASATMPAGATAEAAHVRVSLLVEQAALVAGGEATLGLLFASEPGWHIYWQNPGDVGQAPQVRWRLPPGVAVGPLAWPLPQRLPVGPLMNFGYAGEVLLPAPLYVTADVTGTRLRLTADVHYLACAATCVPGSVSLTRSLPLGTTEAADPAVAGRFAAARRSAPRPLPAPWQARATAAGDDVTLTVTGLGAPVADADFLPAAPRVLDHAVRPRFEARRDDLRLALRRARPRRPLPQALAGTLVVQRTPAETTTYAIVAPLSELGGERAAAGAVTGLGVTAMEGAAPSKYRAATAALRDDVSVPATQRRGVTRAQPGDVGAIPAQPGDVGATPAQPGPLAATGAQPGPVAARGAQPGRLGATGAPPGDVFAAGAQPGEVGVAGTRPGDAAAARAPGTRASLGLWAALLLALGGGAILNLMPCVFPVLSLKLIALAGLSGAAARTGRRHAWAYTLGVVLSFWALGGLVLLLRAGGGAVGWGFQLQAPRFVLAMAAVMVLLAQNLAGTFAVGEGIMGVGQALAAQGGARGALFTGALATLVATPCTAPLMGSAVGYALVAPWPAAMAVMTALGLGLALPYVALAYLPGVVRLLPRPGAWMATFRQAMAFPMVGTAAWLVWLLGVEAGAPAQASALAALTGMAACAWAYGRARRPGGQGLAIVLGLAMLGWAGTRPDMAAPGAPDAAEGTAVSARAGAGVASNVGLSGGATATESATWRPYSDTALATLRRAGRPVLVDFTAAWCVACQVNEAVALDVAAVRTALMARGVVLLRADWTRQDPEITAALARHGRQGVPLVLMYPAGPGAPQILPEVLTPGIVLAALAAAVPTLK